VKIASVFVARKYSSSTYKDEPTTPIRRSSTLQRRTPLGIHSYNCKIEETSATDPAKVEEAAEPHYPPVTPKDKEGHRRNGKDSTAVLAI